MDCSLLQGIIHTSLPMLHWLSHFVKMPGITYQMILEILLGMIIMVLQQAEMIWWVYLHMWNISCSEQSSTLTKLREGTYCQFKQFWNINCCMYFDSKNNPLSLVPKLSVCSDWGDLGMWTGLIWPRLGYNEVSWIW